MRMTFLSLGILSMLCSAHAGNVETKIKNNHFTYGTKKYFRAGAVDVHLGSYGKKKTPLDGGNYIMIQNRLTAANVAKAKPQVSKPVTIDWASFSKSSVVGKVGIKYFAGSGSAAIATDWSNTKTAKLKLIKLSFPLEPLTKAINKNAKALKYLKGNGRGRVVHEVWVVMAGELANHFQSSTSLTASGSGSTGNIKITAKGKASTGKTTTETITLTKGTIFAYAMVKVKKWQRGKTKIKDLEDDLWGLN